MVHHDLDLHDGERVPACEVEARPAVVCVSPSSSLAVLNAALFVGVYWGFVFCCYLGEKAWEKACYKENKRTRARPNLARLS